MFMKLIVAGHLGNDPEMRYMPDGTAVTNLSIASNRSWVDAATGERKQETTWLRASVWGKRAETVHQYLKKGNPIMVEGRLKPDPQTGGPRRWTRQDGTVAASFEMQVDNFSFIGAGNGNGESPTAAVNGQAPVRALTEHAEDEIPF